jgi:amino acid adenylation domain-containing protein
MRSNQSYGKYWKSCERRVPGPSRFDLPRATKQAASTKMRNESSMSSLVTGFAESALRWPFRQALVIGDHHLTYLALQRLASKVASAILQHEREPFPLAAVLAHRSVTAYAGILGILASGKGYVPLNPKFPIQRTKRMLQLARCNVVVVGKECYDLVQRLMPTVDQPLTIIFPDMPETSELSTLFPQHRFVSLREMSGECFPLVSDINPTATAYLLFTSGSTGEPKGVPIHHENVCSYIQYACNRYDVCEHDRFSQIFDLTFDLSVHDMFVCWARGACLFCLPEKSVRAPAKFIRDHHLTMWFSVPSVIGILAKMRLLQPSCFPSLRYSLFCGEPLLAAYASLWQEAAPNSVVENLYGPTETTIAISHYRWHSSISDEECHYGMVPIGWVFEGQKFRVVDSECHTASAGQRGELCLSGSQVCKGYWDDVENTQRRFVKLSGDCESVWYRTGDLVRQDEDGCLHFLGRNDDQVKICGYRVELQEIDAALRSVCKTEQVASISWPVDKGNAKGIVAFVSGLEQLNEGAALSSCRGILPDYMVPSRIVLIAEMPLNANGKVDRPSLVRLLEYARN